MLKKLPNILLIVVLLLVAYSYCLVTTTFADATTPTTIPTDTPGSGTPTVTPLPGGLSSTITPVPEWVPDSEVTFVGKNAARAGLLLNWALDKTNYQWEYLPVGTNNQAEQNPLLPFWTTIRNIVYAMLILFVLVTAFILIATRGKSITVKRFIPRFIAIVLLVTFSFAILQFLYQIGDVIQLFFLRSPTYSTATTIVNISQKDLISFGFDYNSFIGFRLTGDANAESAFMSLLLVKLTAITYYVMVGILILRKVILWFFIILSPVFPLLLLYKPIRNTGKIWIGEFFRWLMYAPLFSIFLAGLVSLWTTMIPLNFVATTLDTTAANFPTAINIELGGPGQKIGPTNSVNDVGTFAEYVVALLMLWVVILLPFILLQIFLNYINNVSFKETPWMQQLISRSPTFFKPPPVSPNPASPPPGRYQTTGLAKSLPYDNAITLPQHLQTELTLPVPEKVNVEILQLTNLSVPTMRDVARFETDHLSSNVRQRQEVSRVQTSLEHVANPQGIVHERLQKESEKGNVLARNILNAADSVAIRSNSVAAQRLLSNIANPAFAATAIERTKATDLRQIIMKENEKGNPTATAFVTSMNAVNRSELSVLGQVLQNLAHPTAIQDVTQQQTFIQLANALARESQLNDPVAVSVLTIIKTMSDKGADITTVTKLREQLRQESQKGNKMATAILSSADNTKVINDVQTLLRKLIVAKQKGDPLAEKILALFSENGVQASTVVSSLPLANRIQTVSIEDYEAVKKMWIENYQKMDIPQNLAGSIKDRTSWITTDSTNIDETITLLASSDQDKVAEGMQHVSNILPFLLIGGFSQTEIIAYLKAKQQAGKEVLEQLKNKDDEEDTTLDVRKENKPATMQASEHMAAEIPDNPTKPSLT